MGTNNKKMDNAHTYPLPLRGLLYLGFVFAILGMGMAVANHFTHLRHFSRGFDEFHTELATIINVMPSSLTASSDGFEPIDSNANTISIEQQLNIQLAVLENSISHLERLHEFQRNSSSTEMLIFIYQFLSALLIGVGTTFVTIISRSLNDIRREAVVVEKQYIEIEKITNKAKTATENWANNISEKEAAQDIISLVSTAYNLINNCLMLLSDYDNATEECKEEHIVFTIQKRFFDALERAANTIGKNLNCKFTPDDQDCIYSYLTGIKASLKDGIKTNSIIFPANHINNLESKIDRCIDFMKKH